MSWHFSAAYLDRVWRAGCLTESQYAQLKSTRIAEKSRWREWRTGLPKPHTQSGQTLTLSTDSLGVAKWTSSVLGFHARSGQPQERNRASKTPNGTSGTPPDGSSVKFDQPSLFSKMSWESDGTSGRSLQNYPSWGMTRNGVLYPQEKPDHLKVVDAGGVSQISYPTPCAHEPRLGYQRRVPGKKGYQQSLTTIVVDMNGGPENGTRLNPDWVEWLQGYPQGWTGLDPLDSSEMNRWSQLNDQGLWFESDPAETGVTTRITTDNRYRKERLRALGNAWVPQQAALAIKTLISLQ